MSLICRENCMLRTTFEKKHQCLYYGSNPNRFPLDCQTSTEMSIKCRRKIFLWNILFIQFNIYGFTREKNIIVTSYSNPLITY